MYTIWLTNNNDIVRLRMCFLWDPNSSNLCICMHVLENQFKFLIENKVFNECLKKKKKKRTYTIVDFEINVNEWKVKNLC